MNCFYKHTTEIVIFYFFHVNNMTVAIHCTKCNELLRVYVGQSFAKLVLGIRYWSLTWNRLLLWKCLAMTCNYKTLEMVDWTWPPMELCCIPLSLWNHILRKPWHEIIRRYNGWTEQGSLWSSAVSHYLSGSIF